MHYIESAELVRVAIPTEAVARDQLVCRLDTLAALDHPHLVPLIAISPNGPNTLDIRLSRTGAVDLPTAVNSRGLMTAAEGAGITVAIAQALAALHSAGIFHGEVRPTDVLLCSDGTAMLRPRMTLPEYDDHSIDVSSLATLVESVLGFPGPSLNSTADEALRAVLNRARALDPRDRPEPGTLAALAYDAVKPDPVRLPQSSALVTAALRTPVSAVGDRRHGRRIAESRLSAVWRVGAGARRRMAHQPVLVMAVIAAGVIAGITIGATTVSHSSSEGQLAAVSSVSTAPDDHAVSQVKDPAGAAAELTSRRMALLSGAVSDIGSVNLQGSPAYMADQQTIKELTQAGVRIVGASVEVLSTEVVSQSPEAMGEMHTAAARTNLAGVELSGAPMGDQNQERPVEVVVRLEYHITAHRQVTANGETPVAASRKSAELLLVWTQDGWRVSEVR